MPIYAYRCAECGHTKDVLQKLSDPALTTCPSCGQAAFSKQVTAAGFQLKGSGWYATDFRSGSGAGPAASNATSGDSTSAPAKTEAATSTSSASDSSGGCGTSCACH